MGLVGRWVEETLWESGRCVLAFVSGSERAAHQNIPVMAADGIRMAVSQLRDCVVTGLS